MASALLRSATLAILLLVAVPALSAQETVRVYLDSTAQTIRGFGAANITSWRPDMTDAEIETAFGTGEGQLGFSILRIKIDRTPSTWAQSVPTAKKAFDRGVLVFASPWNVPTDLLAPGAGTDTLAADKYPEYAQHLADFNTFMANNGVDLYAISVQNEPDYAEEWTGWSPGQIVTFLRNHAPAIGTRVIAPESFQFRRNYTDPILDDPVAAANTDIIGGHTYGDGPFDHPRAREMGKEVWMTEHYTDSQHSADLWPLAFEVAEDIQRTMLSNMNAYVWWYIVRYYGPISDGERSQAFPDEEVVAKGEVTKRGHLMAQFSRFVRPGYVRVHTERTSPFSRVTATAYRDGSDLVVVVLNPGTSEREVTLAFEGGLVDRFQPYVTDETRNVEALGEVAAEGDHLTVALGPRSVTTFVAETVPVASEGGASENVLALGLNRPNPFGESTALPFTLPVAGPVTLSVYDALGREVAVLVDGVRPAGRHEAVLDGGRLPAGVYVVRLTAAGQTAQRRITVVR